MSNMLISYYERRFRYIEIQMDSRSSVELITGVIKQWKMAEIVTSKAY